VADEVISGMATASCFKSEPQPPPSPAPTPPSPEWARIHHSPTEAGRCGGGSVCTLLIHATKPGTSSGIRHHIACSAAANWNHVGSGARCNAATIGTDGVCVHVGQREGRVWLVSETAVCMCQQSLLKGSRGAFLVRGKGPHQSNPKGYAP